MESAAKKRGRPFLYTPEEREVKRLARLELAKRRRMALAAKEGRTLRPWRLSPEERRAKHREYYRRARLRQGCIPRNLATPEALEARKARRKAYLKDYCTRWRAANPEKVREYIKRWRSENPEKVKAYALALRDKPKPIKKSWAQRLQAIALLGGKCAHCGERRPQVLVFDHIKPLLCGGNRRGRREATKHVRDRILQDPVAAAQVYQLLCANCNMAKGTGDHVPL